MYEEVPKNVLERSLLNVHKYQKHQARVRFFALGSLSLASLGAMVPAFSYMLQSFTQSGFYEYASLITSDSKLIGTYWHELTFSLIESLPIVGLALFISISISLIWSLSKATKEAKIIFLTA